MIVIAGLVIGLTFLILSLLGHICLEHDEEQDEEHDYSTPYYRRHKK